VKEDICIFDLHVVFVTIIYHLLYSETLLDCTLGTFQHLYKWNMLSSLNWSFPFRVLDYGPWNCQKWLKRVFTH